MRILSFVEGARLNNGGVGFPALITMGRALADRGHAVIHNICGELSPVADRHTPREPAFARQAAWESISFDVVRWRSVGRWAFAPALPWGIRRLARESDFILLHSLYTFPVVLGYALARLYRKPYGLFPHSVLAPFQRGVSRRRKFIYDRLIARRILDQADVLLFTARGERDEVRPLRLRAPSAIVPLGTDMRQFEPLPPKGRFRDAYFGGHRGPLVLYLGRLNAKKGLDVLIQSMALVAEQVPDLRLAIVGGGDPPSFADAVRAWVSRGGLQARTVMTGLVSDDDKLAALADADVFVSASHAENFGFAMFEAMACSVPVVISTNFNYAAEVAARGAGYAVPRDPSRFAAATLELLGDPDLRRRMGRQGRHLARSYTWQDTAERLERAMDAVVRGRPLPADPVQA